MSDPRIDGHPLMRPSQEVQILQKELATLRAALAELVACKDLKDEVMQMRRMWSKCIDAEMEAGDPDGIAKWADYERRKPLAWATARALATKEPTK